MDDSNNGVELQLVLVQTNNQTFGVTAEPVHLNYYLKEVNPAATTGVTTGVTTGITTDVPVGMVTTGGISAEVQRSYWIVKFHWIFFRTPEESTNAKSALPLIIGVSFGVILIIILVVASLIVWKFQTLGSTNSNTNGVELQQKATNSIEFLLQDIHIEKVIGEGNFGKVFLAKSSSFGIPLALKCLTDPDIQKEFEIECKILR